MKKIFVSFFLFFTIVLFSDSFVFSQTNQTAPQAPSSGTNQPAPQKPQTATTSTPQINIAIKNPLKVDTIEGAVKLLMDAVLRIALPFIVFFFIWSGVNFVLARGNKDKIAQAKKMFWYTILGTLLILGAWTITNIIIGTVNTITG